MESPVPPLERVILVGFSDAARPEGELLAVR